MVTYGKQSGMTLVAIVIIIGLIGFFTLLTLRVAPLYIENYKVQRHLSTLQQESRQADMNAAQVKETLLKRFQLDDIEHVTKDNISVEEKRGSIKVKVSYEVRTKFISNLDVVGVFRDMEVEIP